MSVVQRAYAVLRDCLNSTDTHPTTHREKAISAVGGFVGILMVFWVSSRILDLHGAALMVASMGASAVLLFAVPHGTLSQPWPLIGGNLLSAAVGVTCAAWIANPLLAGPLAVAIAIVVMYYLRCIHPPGGATALVAVVGGPQVHALGYGYLLEPVLVNVVVILTVAVLVNYPFAWRRYPAILNRGRRSLLPLPVCSGEKCMIAHSDLVYALSELDSFIDVSEEDLLRIYTSAMRHAIEPADIAVGPVQGSPIAAYQKG
ncbi:HPP family protein [Thiohalomonas denitrificans]|uniref:HPP family protein n=1 Tax=Thiohalomonas denitrificans TaxID=415747 RepID=A0A1G5Q8M2_9GAMM|nr:HPP family protein [Thiohalomonas denitrificans]SCZ57609.1 HPP family protein [Thiohalomonas denitrificans]